MSWMTVLQIVGKAAAEPLIDKYAGADGPKLKKLLLGKDETVKQGLHDIDRQLKEIVGLMKEVQVQQRFDIYNHADLELDRLFRTYTAQLEKRVDDPDRQNACETVLASDGALAQGRRLVGALLRTLEPTRKSVLQEYGEWLERRNTDVFTYCDRMGAVIDHLKINLIEAVALREAALNDLIDKPRRKDAPFSAAEVATVDTEIAPFVKEARELAAKFDQFTVGSARLKHVNSGQFLTGYGNGDPSSKDTPFQKYAQGHSMPQVFPWTAADGSTMQYTEAVKGTITNPQSAAHARANTVTVQLRRSLQQWHVLRDSSVTDAVVLKHSDTDRVLCIDAGNVQLADRSSARARGYFSPVLARTLDKPVDSIPTGAFLLRHKDSGRMLDCYGGRVYADGINDNRSNTYLHFVIEPAAVQ